MTDRLRELLEVRTCVLFDIDDDQRLLMGDDASGSTQLVEREPDGTLRWLTDLGEPCSGRYLPGQRAIVLSADDGGTERAQLWLLHPDGRREPMANDPRFIHTLLDVLPGRVVYSTNRRNGVDFDVVVRDVATGGERVVWDGGGWFEYAAVSPDERWVVLGRMTLVAASSALLLVDVESATSTPITDPDQPGEWIGPTWSPDSSAVIASSDAGTERVEVRRYDLAKARWTTLLSSPDHDLTGRPAPDGATLAVVATADGADALAVHRLDGDGVGPATTIGLPERCVITFRSPLVWSPDSTALGFTLASMIDPPSVHVWRTDGESAPQCVHAPAAPGTTDGLVDGVSHLVPTPDGEQIPVYVLTPADADGSVVLVVHGGPEAASVRSWNPVIAALAAAGHTVVVPNVRGSAGYGRRWVSLDDVERRLDSVADLAAIHAWLPEIGVDPTRAALYGGSYGGYMVLAGLAFQPDLWAAGVDIVGISSLVTFLENTSAYRRAYREREYGTLAHAPRRTRAGVTAQPDRPGPRPAVRDPRRQRPARAPVGGRAGGRRGAQPRGRLPAAGVRRRGPRPGQAGQPAGRVPAGVRVSRSPPDTALIGNPTGTASTRPVCGPRPGKMPVTVERHAHGLLAQPARQLDLGRPDRGRVVDRDTGGVRCPTQHLTGVAVADDPEPLDVEPGEPTGERTRRLVGVRHDRATPGGLPPRATRATDLVGGLRSEAHGHTRARPVPEPVALRGEPGRVVLATDRPLRIQRSNRRTNRVDRYAVVVPSLQRGHVVRAARLRRRADRPIASTRRTVDAARSRR